MNRFFAAIALLALPFTMACGGVEGPAPAQLSQRSDGLAVTQGTLTNVFEGSDGSGSTNALSSTEFHERMPELLSAIRYPLLVNNAVNTQIVSKLHLGEAGGQELFNYILKCALPKDDVVVYDIQGTPHVSGPGEGLLQSGLSWKTTTFDTPSKVADLVGCLLAHVNPREEAVPIFLAGSQIVPRANHLPEYPVDEALWTVKVTIRQPVPVSGGFSPAVTQIEYHVWPLFTTPDCITSSADIDAALKRRVCGQDPEQCNLVKHNDVNSECTEVAPQQFNCKVHPTADDQPAIKTMLEVPEDLETFYCPLPQ